MERDRGAIREIAAELHNLRSRAEAAGDMMLAMLVVVAARHAERVSGAPMRSDKVLADWIAQEPVVDDGEPYAE